MLDAAKRDSWLDLPQATQAEAATRVIHAVESSAYQLADTLPPNAPPRIEVEVNLVVQVNVISAQADDDVSDVCFDTRRDDFRDSPWREKSNSIRLTGDSIKQLGVDGERDYVIVVATVAARTVQLMTLLNLAMT